MCEWDCSKRSVCHAKWVCSSINLILKAITYIHTAMLWCLSRAWSDELAGTLNHNSVLVTVMHTLGNSLLAYKNIKKIYFMCVCTQWWEKKHWIAKVGRKSAMQHVHTSSFRRNNKTIKTQILIILIFLE